MPDDTRSADLPPTDGLRFLMADGSRVIARPSGTEPKLKCYLEVVVPVDPGAGVDAARISAATFSGGKRWTSPSDVRSC